MAQKARKDRAKSNTEALKNLHSGSLIVNSVFILFYFIFKSRSIWTWLIISVPSFLCEFALERTGRPRFDPSTKALTSSGEDLNAAGLTEYMFDVVWVTWFTTLLAVLLGDSAWFFWAIVPAYGAMKGFRILGAAKQMAGMSGKADLANEDVSAPAGNRRQRRAA